MRVVLIRNLNLANRLLVPGKLEGPIRHPPIYRNLEEAKALLRRLTEAEEVTGTPETWEQTEDGALPMRWAIQRIEELIDGKMMFDGVMNNPLLGANVPMSEQDWAQLIERYRASKRRLIASILDWD